MYFIVGQANHVYLGMQLQILGIFYFLVHNQVVHQIRQEQIILQRIAQLIMNLQNNLVVNSNNVTVQQEKRNIVQNHVQLYQIRNQRFICNIQIKLRKVYNLRGIWYQIVMI